MLQISSMVPKLRRRALSCEWFYSIVFRNYVKVGLSSKNEDFRTSGSAMGKSILVPESLCADTLVGVMQLDLWQHSKIWIHSHTFAYHVRTGKLQIFERMQP